MSQTSDLLSDDDGRGSHTTCSDKYTDEASVSFTGHEGEPRLQRQHTEVSEISDSDLYDVTNTDEHTDGIIGSPEECLVSESEKLGKRVHYDSNSIPNQTKCNCVNCLNEQRFLQFGQHESLLDHGSTDHYDHTHHRQGYLIQGHADHCLHHHYPQGHWQGISISDDEIEIIADPEYYNDHVFYVDPAVARSLLSDFLLQEERPANLHIHVDTRTKRQRFIARAVMIISMTMFTVSALLVMISLIMSDHIDDLVRGTNTLLRKTSEMASTTPPTTSASSNDSFELSTADSLTSTSSCC